MSNSKAGVVKGPSWLPKLPDNMVYDVLLKSIHMLQRSTPVNSKQLSLLWKPTKLMLQKCGPGFSILWLVQGKFNGIIVLILKNGLTVIMTAAKSSACTVLCIDPLVVDEYSMPVIDFLRGSVAETKLQFHSFYNSAILFVQSSDEKYAKILQTLTELATPAMALLTLHFKDVLQATYENININYLLSEILFYLQKLFQKCTIIFDKGVDLYKNSNCNAYLKDIVSSTVSLLRENKTLFLECFRNILKILFKLVKVIFPASITSSRMAYNAARFSCNLSFRLMSELVYAHPVICKSIAHFTFKTTSLISAVILKTISLLLELRPYVWATAKNITLRYCKFCIEITPLIMNLLKDLCIDVFKASCKVHAIVWPICYAGLCRVYKDLKPALYIFCNDVLPKITIAIRNALSILYQIMLSVPHISFELTLQTYEVFSYYYKEVNPVVLERTKDVSIYSWNVVNSMKSGMSMAVHDLSPSIQPIFSQQLYSVQYGLNVVSSDVLLATKCVTPTLCSGYEEITSTLIDACYAVGPLASSVCVVVFPDLVNATYIVAPVLLSALVELSSDARQALYKISPSVWLAVCTATPVLWQGAIKVAPTSVACAVEAGVKIGVMSHVVYGALCSASFEVSAAFTKAAIIVNKDITKGCFRVASDAKTLFLETQLVLSSLGNKTLPICSFAVHETMTLIWIVRYYDVRSKTFRSTCESQFLLRTNALQYKIASMVKRRGKRAYGLTVKFALRGKIYISKSNEIALSIMYEANLKAVQCYQKVSPLVCGLALRTCAYLTTFFPTENTSISYAYITCLKVLLVFNNWFLVNDVSPILTSISCKSLLLVESMSYNLCINLCKIYPIFFNSISCLLQYFWSVVRSVAPEIWSCVCEVSPIAWQIFCQIIRTAWNYATRITPPLYNLSCEQTAILWEFVSLVVPKIHAILRELSPQVWTLLCDLTSSSWHLLCHKCPIIWDFVCQTLPPVWQQICSLSAEHWDGMVELITSTWSLICANNSMGWKMNCVLISSAWNTFFYSNMLALASLQNIDPLLLEYISKFGSLLWTGICIAIIITFIMHEYNFSVKSLLLEPSPQGIRHNADALIGKDAIEIDDDTNAKALQLLQCILNNVTTLRSVFQNAKSLAAYYFTGQALKSSLRLSEVSFVTSCKKISTKLIPERILKSNTMMARTSRKLTSYFQVTPFLDVMSTVRFIS